MTYHDTDIEVEKSTNKWMTWGVVFLFLFVLAFPVYRILQPANLEEAEAALNENLSAQGEEIFSSSCAQCHGGLVICY